MSEPPLEPPRDSLTDLFSRLASNSSALVREELALARREMSDSLKALAARMLMILAGALLGLVALAALSAAAVIGLSKVMDPLAAALVVGAALTVIALLLAWIGSRQLKKVSLKPQQTIETLEEGKRWMRDLT